MRRALWLRHHAFVSNRLNMKCATLGSATLESAFTTPVTATAEEVQLARELRRQLKQRLLDELDQASRPSAAWCVGAD